MILVPFYIIRLYSYWYSHPLIIVASDDVDGGGFFRYENQGLDFHNERRPLWEQVQFQPMEQQGERYDRMTWEAVSFLY